jgi:F-type H+-transporting ATPase subunit delta
MTAATEFRLRSLDVLLDGVSVDDAFASDLFAVVDVLESSAALRRAVTDPGAPEGARKALVHGLFQGKVSESVITFVGVAAEMRWAGGRTFAAALDRQAVRAELAAAEQAGTLDETEDELFRFARTVEANPDLRNVLADRSVPVDKRTDLVGELLGGRASDSTVRLAKRAVHARERTFAHTIEGYVTLAAAQKNRVVATVRVAQALSSDQRDRLRTALTKQVGREVAVQEIIDPSVLGGVRVEFGDEVIEGTVASRLDEARRLFG